MPSSRPLLAPLRTAALEASLALLLFLTLDNFNLASHCLICLPFIELIAISQLETEVYLQLKFGF